MEKFIRSLRFLLQSMNSSSLSNTKSLTVTPDLLQQHPFLIDLIHCLESNLSSEFSIDFISNLVSNLVHTKNFFRYKQSVKDFAASVYILGGRNVYQLIRLNIPESFPSLTTLRIVISSSKYHFVEGEFQYSSLKDFTNSFDCKYAFCGVDSTSVIPKVSYDIRSNSFVGFTLPLKMDFLLVVFISTNSLFKLATWHNEVDKSSLLNTHVIQAICPVTLFSTTTTTIPPTCLRH